MSLKLGVKDDIKLDLLAKLSDAESEACETQVWIEFAIRCNYIDEILKYKLDKAYDQITGQLVKMIDDPEKWLIK
jgi:four helix bundle protein